MSKLVKRYGLWRLVHITLAGTIVFLAIAFGAELAAPVVKDFDMGATLISVTPDVTEGRVSLFEPARVDFARFARMIRPRLFRAATPLRDKPMADKTIERIRAQLKLQCVIRIDGKPVAYINVKGTGLKKCEVGDSVADLFTVIDIKEKSVEIKIVDHKVTLKL